jgi:hypothetical protein
MNALALTGRRVVARGLMMPEGSIPPAREFASTGEEHRGEAESENDHCKLVVTAWSEPVKDGSAGTMDRARACC